MYRLVPRPQRPYYGPMVPRPRSQTVAATAAGIAGYAYSRFNRAGSTQAAARGVVRYQKRARNIVKTVRKIQKAKTPMKKLQKEVKLLKQLNESDQGTLIYRKRTTGVVQAAVNARGFSNYVHSDTSHIEAVLGQLRYYNPSAPSSLTTADGTTGSYQKEFLVTRQYSKLKISNNYQVPCKYIIYLCRPKEDTSITPGTAWSNGLSDVSNGTTSSLIIYPTDSPQFTDLYRVEKTCKGMLQPGQSRNCSMSDKAFQYDPSLVDSHALSYQKRYHSGLYLICISGVLAHDSAVTTEQGYAQAGVDVSLDQVVEVKYSAGADVKYVYVTDGSDSFTNGALISSKPVADNQGYSLS